MKHTRAMNQAITEYQEANEALKEATKNFIDSESALKRARNIKTEALTTRNAARERMISSIARAAEGPSEEYIGL